MARFDPSAVVRSRPRARVSTLAIVAGLLMLVSLFLSLGLSALFWVPLVFLVGVAMLTVWGARRRRQRYEDRDERDVKDPLRSGRSWPTQGVVDDRLPDPGKAAEKEGTPSSDAYATRP